MNLFSKIKNARIKATSAMLVAGTAAISAMPIASAAYFGNMFTNISGVFKEAYNGLVSLATPVALACGAFCLIMMFLQKDQKKMETYKSWLIGIVICVIVLNALNGILTVAANFGSSLNLS